MQRNYCRLFRQCVNLSPIMIPFKVPSRVLLHHEDVDKQFVCQTTCHRLDSVRGYHKTQLFSERVDVLTEY